MSIANRRLNRGRSIDPDKPRGLPTAGRLPMQGGNFLAGVRQLFKPHPSEAIKADHRADPAFSKGLWKALRGWRGRIVAGE